jgi:hypothetical protein
MAELARHWQIAIGVVFAGAAAGTLLTAGLEMHGKINDARDLLYVGGALAGAAALCWMGSMVLKIKASDPSVGNSVLRTGGYALMATVVYAGLSLGSILEKSPFDPAEGRADYYWPTVYTAVGIACGVVASAVAGHSAKKETAGRGGGGGKSAGFVTVQVVFGLTAPLLAMMAIFQGLQKAPETVPLQLAAGATLAGFFSFGGFLLHFSRCRGSVLFLWLVIAVDMGAAVASAAAAAFLYRMGGRASAVADNPETVVWLLLASTVVKLAHWSVAHAWTAVKEKGE